MRAFSIHSRLRLLVLASALPLIAFALGLVLWHSRTAQEFLRQDASRTAGTAGQVIDRELAGALTGLQVLAASPSLAQQDFGQFHGMATAAAGVTGNSVIILYDRAGNRVVSTAVAYGDPLPPRQDMSMFAPVFDSGKPYVTRLFTSETMKRPTVGIMVPVKMDGQVHYVLGAGLLSQRLSELLATSGLPQGWVAALLDQDGTIIARTRNPEQFVGQKAVPEVWRRMQEVKGAAGTVEGVTKEGDAALLTFARSEASGWMTVIGIPMSVLQAELRTSLLLVAGAAAILLLLASVLAWWAARQISQPVDQMQAAARALEEGAPVRVAPTGIEQFDRLAQAMDHAGREILKRKHALQESFDELQAAHRQLREEHDQKDRFLATLAHELRNPLAPIRNGVHILRRGAPAPLAAKTLAMMDRQLSHMVRLVDDLLDVARMAQGKPVLQKEDVTLQQVVALAAEAIAPQLQAGGQTLAVQAPETPLWVHADATRLAQVLINVLNNAIKFSAAGSSITVSLGAEGEEAEIRVRDSGEGIPPDKLEEVFEFFSQIGGRQDVGRGSGLGVGLSLSRLLVELHGGSIVALSKGQGHGTTIAIALPLSRTAHAAVATTASPAKVGATALRLLVVDDNVDAADTVAEALRMAGHTVAVAHDGAAALRLAQDTDFDVVVLDIGMPGMDGYEVCRRLRRIPRHSRTTIVALTGWGAPSDREKSKAAGFDAHLTKPVDWSQLEQVLDTAHALV